MEYVENNANEDSTGGWVKCSPGLMKLYGKKCIDYAGPNTYWEGADGPGEVPENVDEYPDVPAYSFPHAHWMRQREPEKSNPFQNIVETKKLPDNDTGSSSGIIIGDFEEKFKEAAKNHKPMILPDDAVVTTVSADKILPWGSDEPDAVIEIPDALRVMIVHELRSLKKYAKNTGHGNIVEGLIWMLNGFEGKPLQDK